MSFSLIPKEICPCLEALTPELLEAHGVKLLMMDFDNTIVPYTTSVPTAQMDAWLRRMHACSQVRLCIVSNTKKQRAPDFAAKYGIPIITHAKKPFPHGIRECLRRFSLRPEECALVGDQIFTDVLGANCAGLRSILIPAIDNHTFLLKLRHLAELPFILIGKRRLQHEKH